MHDNIDIRSVHPDATQPVAYGHLGCVPAFAHKAYKDNVLVQAGSGRLAAPSQRAIWDSMATRKLQHAQPYEGSALANEC
jgi:hypothetical protein